ncbi:MAG: UDP-N-acetylmuramate:L-alanyl-gamma-D-glutamyl-meso-diaminopimelate ligase [Deltaproteobacteria bacterium]|nr:UDP-N-acetylmuramate:L-alanyl-gamma-D-glutamyl-meso-diaminopimelate ligase [Deltaproteobacteria bacterium]
MDPSRNKAPLKVRTIHLSGVCGTGMGALAGMLKDSGYMVKGSDANVYPPMSVFLEKKGIPVAQGYSAKNLEPAPDLVVLGNALSRDNPESVAVRENGLYYVSFPQALNELFASGKSALLVTGTHGKTTTSALLSWVLFSAGLDPTFMVGGIATNFESNHRVGQGPHMVIEGDEYDSAFFDKRPKFLHYRPTRAILTSVEFDHADIYADLAAVVSAFGLFVEGLDPECLLVHHVPDENIDGILKRARCRTASYGTGPDAFWRFSDVSISPPFTNFSVYKGDALFGSFKTPLQGEHNLLNALSVIAVADDLGLSSAQLAEGLSTFAGIYRRQQVRGVKNGVTVMDDFAHHPTAVRETIKALKPFYPDGRLVAVFEPRTNSSRRNVFQDVYPAAFDKADTVVIRKPPLLEKIPANDRFSSEKLVEDINARGVEARFFDDTESIIGFLADFAKPGDLILVMSNGGFDNIHARLLEAL